MMKHIHTIVLLLLMLLPLGNMAQSLTIVEDFKIIENSSAMVAYYNQFGDYEKPAMDDTFPYAVVRVLLEGNAHEVTAAKKMLGVYTGLLSEGVKASYLDFENEILFLVPSNVGHVELSCGDGCARKTILELPKLQSNAVYWGKVHYTPMVGPIPTGSTQAAKRQYFSFQVTPANATVQVLEDGQWELWEKEDGVFSKSLYYGTYSYKVYADRFQTEEGTIELNDTCKEKVVKLLPDYGWLTIESSTVSKGASVFITSKQMSEPKFIGTIPFKNKELDKGEYVLQVQQTKYKKYVQNINIQPNKTTRLAPELSPNFVSLTLSTDSESEIYVDGKRYAKGSWTGTLELGEYSIEARKQYHRSAVMIVHITDNHANQTIEIDSPKPIYGSLHVKGSPSKASVYVDGKLVGTSPLIVNDLLIGEHEVKVEKDGCAVWKKTVTVADNEECIAKYELEKGVSLERIVLKGMNATNLSVKRAGDETLLFTYDLPKKGPVRLRMSTDGYTYTTQKNVQGAVGKEIDKGEGYQISWTIPKDLGRTMQDSLYFQIVALPEFPKKQIKIGSLYYQAVDDGTSVEVDARFNRNKKVTIPAEINYKGYKYSVTSIGEEAFDYCYELTSITIPNSVTSIGEEAFSGCDKLTSITIPNSVTSIGSNAFEDCKNLTSITIPNSVTSIGNNVFESCFNLTSITIPNSVTSIGDYAFSQCYNLTSITIPNSVTSIGDYAFSQCYNLTSITIPNSVTSIGDYAFSQCYNLTSIIIPNSVTTIGNEAFSYSNLTSITIPNSVTSIGSRAFASGGKLTSITIPNSVTSIGYCAFEDCDNLTSIIVDKNNPIYDSRNDCNAIIETKTNTLIAGCKNTLIPNSATSIGNYAFEDCKNLTSITIPNSVTSIGYRAFYWCSNLTSITIPNSVTSIGGEAFASCGKLTSITIPNSVTSIGYRAFYWCSNLTSITIPNSVTSIGDWAFSGCSKLTSITIPNSVTSIGYRAFDDCDNITSIKIPKSVTSIGASAFSGCDKLTKIYIPRGTKAKFAAMEGLKDHVDKLVER